MTYLGFHLVFILPPIVLLSAALVLRPPRLGPRARWSLPLLALLALLWTTPWDNYLVWRGVWVYGAERVLGTLGFVPYEEYAFFLLQPVLTGLWLYVLLGRLERPEPAPQGVAAAGAGPLVAWTLLTLAGIAMLFFEHTTYLGLILAWACPMLAGQWLYAGAIIRRLRTTVRIAIAAPTLWLWMADWVAIRLGIWDISPLFTTGLHLAGLPIEEATFFLLTNVLIVQGLVLFLFPPAAPVRR